MHIFVFNTIVTKVLVENGENALIFTAVLIANKDSSFNDLSTHFFAGQFIWVRDRKNNSAAFETESLFLRPNNFNPTSPWPSISPGHIPPSHS